MHRPKQNVDLQRCWDLRETGGTGIVCEGKDGTAYMESQKQIQMVHDMFAFERVRCVVLCSKTGTGGPEYCADRGQSAGRTAVGSAFVRHSEGVGAEYRYTGSDLSGTGQAADAGRRVYGLADAGAAGF